MTLGEALKLVQQRKSKSRRRSVFLVCGFQPLHLETFLQGHFASRHPEEAIDIQTGLYGDVERALSMAAESEAEAAVVVFEYADLDPRLGLRSTGNWALSVQADILENCQGRLTRLLEGLRQLAARMPAVLVPPTLPTPLLGHTTCCQWSTNELELQKQAAVFFADAARIGGVAVLNPSNLGQASAESKRLDAALELRAGFPYTIGHASAVASQAVSLLFPRTPRKGLITDLDETFWSGIVGEVGPSGVSWGLADNAQIHGLYQQMLRHLSEMGVLLAIVSKNQPAVVEEALSRGDLLVAAKSFFPVITTWGRKSEGIAEVLKAWNIGADSVVFVDDSAMELEEVKTAFPEITCLRFSPKLPARTFEMLQELRDLFGKPVVQPEDAIRQASIRTSALRQQPAELPVDHQFLRGLEGKVTFDLRKVPGNTRLLELINKTNQFNLNGLRLSEGEWLKHLREPCTLVVAVSYADKFGPLGTIAVMSGRKMNQELELTSWVISCRAFSRMIEHHMLDHLFRVHGCASVRMDFHATARNQPLQSYLESLGVDLDGAAAPSLSWSQFQNHIKELPHQVCVIGQ